MKATNEEDAKRLYKETDKYFGVAQVMFYIAGGVWLLNIIDAVLNADVPLRTGNIKISSDTSVTFANKHKDKLVISIQKEF